MKAFTLDRLEGPPALRDDLAAPTVADDEVLVRVRASSVNPVDNSIASGMLAAYAEYEFPIVLGRDYAGVVEQVGAAVTRYTVGDEVFGFVLHANPTVHDGSWAELIAVPESTFVARAPAGVDLVTAGAAPLAGITAMLAVDALGLSAGRTVLIIGATGGVGSIAVQLATRVGATVIAPGLPEDAAYLRGLGVETLLDREADIAASVRSSRAEGVDALLDLVSYTPEAFAVYEAALSTGGRAASPLGAAGDGLGRTNVMAVPSPENLDRLGRLLADGVATVNIQKTYALAAAGEALQAQATTHVQGKLAIQVS